MKVYHPEEKGEDVQVQVQVQRPSLVKLQWTPSHLSAFYLTATKMCLVTCNCYVTTLEFKLHKQEVGVVFRGDPWCSTEKLLQCLFSFEKLKVTTRSKKGIKLCGTKRPSVNTSFIDYRHRRQRSNMKRKLALNQLIC